MLKKIKKIVKLTKSADDQSVGMQRKLLLYLASLVMVVFTAMILIFSLSGVFSISRKELSQALNVHQKNRVYMLGEQLEELNDQILSEEELNDLSYEISHLILESDYGNMITLLAVLHGEEMVLGEGTLRCAEGTDFSDIQPLLMEKGKYFDTYADESEKYFGVNTLLDLKTADGSSVCAVTLMRAKPFVISEMKKRILWSVGSLGFLFAMLGFSFVMSKRFVKPISNYLAEVMQEQSADGSTGIREIDEIVSNIRMESRKNIIDESGFPPDMEELFTEFTNKVKTLTHTERTILQYYIDGYTIEEIAEKAFISINTAKKHNTNLNRKLGTTSRDELLLYIELFRRGDRLEEISYNREEIRSEKI